MRPSKLKWIVLLVGQISLAVVSMITSVWLYLQTGLTIGVISGSFVALFSALFAIVGTFALVTKEMWARLDAEGFETRTVWGSRRRRRWRETAGFAPLWINFWHYTAYDDDNPPSGWWDAANRAYAGGKSFFPDTYGLGAKNLADLMTAWRQRALAPPS